MSLIKLVLPFCFLIVTPLLVAEEKIGCRQQIALHYAIKHVRANSCASLKSDFVAMKSLFALCDTANNKNITLSTLMRITLL